MPLKIVVLALLAIFASDEDPRAGRVWSSIFNRFCEEIAHGLSRDFIKPFEFFFRETDDRLGRLVAELAHVQDNNPGRFDGNPREVVLEIASQTQSKMHDLMIEANDRLEGLVQYRIVKVERELLEASRTLKDL